MKKYLVCVLCLVVLLLSGCAGQKWVAKVNGQPITEDEFTTRVHIIRWMAGSQVDVNKEKGNILDSMVDEQILLQEADKQKVKVDETKFNKDFADFEKYMESMYGGKDKVAAEAKKYNVTMDDIKAWYHNQYKIQALLDKISSNVKLTDAEKKAAQTKYAGYKEVKARHILVSSRSKAEEILAKIKGGMDFVQAAKQYTEEPGGKERGGDLGWFGRGQMVKAFEDAAFSLKKRQVSGVVETEFGYHIIKVEDIRGPEYQALQEKQAKVKMDYLNKLRKEAKVEKKKTSELPSFSSGQTPKKENKQG